MDSVIIHERTEGKYHVLENLLKGIVCSKPQAEMSLRFQGEIDEEVRIHQMKVEVSITYATFA